MSREKQREIPVKADAPPTRRELRTNGRLTKLAPRVGRVVRAAEGGVDVLCQFLLRRCIIYKRRLAPAGSLAARINDVAARVVRRRRRKRDVCCVRYCGCAYW
jgi:hypothetical protein